ncbi:DUF1552 domain-containing protein [Sandaracinus amylolyticus]|uniref:DUF1552 domain-containing protein n=1 Tax=Sandaracinus amylolyticus TaxID=927083 RepID=UPI001F40C5DC|nr:DUF1552 domain-containing protein [Sandaracinus amylolyticus]UJR82597.1 Hypothetical protein I5071_46620 [Sandaracinus amylolyticus]
MSAWSKKKLGRRFFLGGAGAAIALPFLPSAVRMLEGRGTAHADHASCETPKRLLAWYVPCGIHMAAWRPTSTGRDFALPEILQPLEPVRGKMNVLTGIANMPARPDGPGDHAAGTGSFITATHVVKTEGSDIRNGVSMDQVAATHLGSCTRFASLELGIDGGGPAGGCDSGYSCAYARNVSWSGPQTPMPKMTDVRAVFDRLFDGFDPTASLAEIERRRAYRTSVLDVALEDANSLRPRLGTTDQRKLDEYLTAVREVELRISSEETLVCEVPGRPAEDLDLTARIDVMSDLQAIAMQCDLTRVITFMMANAGSNRSYPFLGIGDGHHSLSHHQGNAENHRKLTLIDRWEMERFSYFLQKLDSIEEPGGGTLLDTCAVFLSSEISDGDRHNHDDMPILVAGTAGGAWETGRHVVYDGRPPVANLFTTLLNAVGVPSTRFGDDGTGPLTI